MYHLWKYVYGARKSKSMLWPCVSVLNLRIRVCSCFNLSSLLEIYIYIYIYIYVYTYSEAILINYMPTLNQRSC